MARGRLFALLHEFRRLVNRYERDHDNVVTLAHITFSTLLFGQSSYHFFFRVLMLMYVSPSGERHSRLRGDEGVQGGRSRLSTLGRAGGVG